MQNLIAENFDIAYPFTEKISKLKKHREGRKMIDVLCIGQYDKTGKFTTIQWKCFIRWCRIVCDEVIVYSRMSYHNVCAVFHLYCHISKLARPDEAIDIYAYKIDVDEIAFWDSIASYNFDIDNLDEEISHIFFLNKGKLMASLEIVDDENYVLIERDARQKDELFTDRQMISENIQLCLKGKEDIDGVVEEGSWRPLGV